MLSPGIAIPHARSEDDVRKQGLSLLIVRSGINFAVHNDPIRIVVMFFIDKQSHVNMLSQPAEILGNEELVMALSNSYRVEEVIALIHAT